MEGGGFVWPISLASPVDKDTLPAKMCYDQNKQEPAADQTVVAHDSANPNNKRKRKPTKIIPLEKKRKVRKNLTLELPKQEGTVRFDEIVLVKVGGKQKMVRLKGYPSNAFYKKRRLQKLNMHLKHLNRAMTPRRLKIQQHVRDTLVKVNL